jgi:hypothetical protein
MTFHLSQPIPFLSRPLTERVIAAMQILLAAGPIATAVPIWAAEATYPQSTSTAHAQAQMVGAFTGQFVDGVAVYRLSPVVVVASRKVELAKMEREEQSTRAKQARAKTGRRPA